MIQSIYFPRPGVTVQALTEAALRDLGSMDVEGIDSAADAALTLSGLKMEFATPGDVLGEAGRYLYRQFVVLTPQTDLIFLVSRELDWQPCQRHIL